MRVPGIAPRRVRVPVGHIDIAPTLLNLARGTAEPAFIGRSLLSDAAGPPAPDTDTRAVFQEVTSERGKKRALATTTRHLIWNAVPGDTTECYDRTRDPSEDHDIWQQATGGWETHRETDRAWRWRARSSALVAGLALPDGAADKLRQAVTPPGVATRASRTSVARRRSATRSWCAASMPAPTPCPPAARSRSPITSRPASRSPAGWRLFFHLEGPVGYRNLDHVPVDGLMPLERWRPGQTLRDRQRIPIPAGTPGGTYTLYLGAYRGAERLPVTPASLNDGKDRLRLLSFTVTPSTASVGRPSGVPVPVAKASRAQGSLSPPRSTVGPAEGPTPRAKGSRGQSPLLPTR